MWEKIDRFVREQQLIPDGSGILIGLSGGADSVCLLRYLAAAREKRHLTLLAVHVHHGIRGEEADRDRAFSEALCGRLQIPFRTVYRDIPAEAAAEGLTLEEAGRKARYEIFYALAKKLGENTLVAVAHHQRDQAETVLHHLLRGSGLTGLGGIRPRSGAVIRPLLETSREEIEEILKALGQDWCTDSTNADPAYLRNRIRGQLLPWLEEEINPRAVCHIAETALRLQHAEDYLRGESSRFRRAYVRQTENGMTVSAKALAVCPQILQEYVIQEMLEAVCGRKKDLEAVHITQIRELTGRKEGSRISLPYRMQACFCGGQLIIEGLPKEQRGTAEEAEERREILLSLPPGPGQEACFGPLRLRVMPREEAGEIPQKQYTKWLDYDKISGNLSLRKRRPGDYFLLPGGKRKTLKRFLIDEKIPARIRGELPLLADGDHILWIIGRRISEGVKITEETRRVLRVDWQETESSGPGMGVKR